MMRLFVMVAALMLRVVLAQAADTSPATDCAAIGNLVPYCGLTNPEDLEVLPGGDGVITSDMHIVKTANGLAGQPGTLKLLDLRTRAITVLYPSATAPPGRNDWGDPSCPGEIGASLLPHGLQLSKRRDGAWQLLVVNHNGRESVEFFELINNGKREPTKGKADHGDNQWSLSWRGCVVPTGTNHLNDVAALPDGGLLVTTMHTGANAETRHAMRKAEGGENTGFVWRWQPASGLSHLPGSDSPMPNGVQVDAAGQYAYLNTASKGGDVRKIDLANGQVVATVVVPKPDNSSWASDGRLLVAGVAADAVADTCFANPDVVCSLASDVYAIDTHTMQVEKLFSHTGLPMGGFTVAVQSGRDLLIGSCFGDRIMSVRDFFKSTASTVVSTKAVAP